VVEPSGFRSGREFAAWLKPATLAMPSPNTDTRATPSVSGKSLQSGNPLSEELGNRDEDDRSWHCSPSPSSEQAADQYPDHHAPITL